MATLKDHFANFIGAHGFYMVHIHGNNAIPCPDCQQAENATRCERCLGLGLVATIAPVKVRMSQAMRPDYNEQNETHVGIMGPQDTFIYCYPETDVSEGDLFVAVTWDVPESKVMRYGNVARVHKIYEANRVEPKHGMHGVYTYQRISAHDIDIDIQWLRDRLRNRPVDQAPVEDDFLNAATYNFIIEQGTTFVRDISLRTALGTPIIVTGATITAQARLTAADENIAFEFTTAIPNDNTIRISLTDEQTSALAINTYVYDVEIEFEDETVMRLLEGRITISAEVSRA